MPRYELMYLLGSHVADDEVPKISEQVKKFVEEAGGSNIVETSLGKKKLAYTIKKTRNGYYVVVDFTMEGSKVNELDARVRSQANNIIRYILVNQDEHLDRIEKDKKVAAKLNRRIPVEGQVPTPKVAEPAVKKEMPVIDLSQEDIDRKIEEALAEDITK